MATASADMPCSAPSPSSSQTDRDAASSRSMAITTSAEDTACRGVDAAVAPAATSGWVASGVRFHTDTERPVASRRWAMRLPMAPVPSTVTRKAVAALMLSWPRAQRQPAH